MIVDGFSFQWIKDVYDNVILSDSFNPSPQSVMLNSACRADGLLSSKGRSYIHDSFTNLGHDGNLTIAF